MRRMRYSSLVAAMLVAVLALTVSFGACAKPVTPTPQPPVKIGLMVYATGGAKLIGDMGLYGAELAIKEINEAGGILDGRKVEYQVYDVGYSAEVTTTSVKKAISDGAKGLVGFMDATDATVGSAICKDLGIPIVIGGAGSGKFMNPGWTGQVHVEAYPEVLYGGGVCDWVEEQGFTKVVQVAFDSEYSHCAELAYRQRFDQPGSPVEFPPVIWVPYGATECTTEITKAVAMEPDVIILDIWGATIVFALQKLSELGYEGARINPMCTMIPEFLEPAGEAADGLLGTEHWVLDPTVEENVEFAERFREFAGTVPISISALCYEAAMILLLGMDKAGTDSGLEEIGEAMLGLDFMTPLGVKMEILPNGQVHSPFCYQAKWDAKSGKVLPERRLELPKEYYDTERIIMD